jgi:hypothetical protein
MRRRLRGDDEKYGTRQRPRNMLTAEAAVALSKNAFRKVWVRLPMYEGTFAIWPGGRKEFYPDRKRA